MTHPAELPLKTVLDWAEKAGFSNAVMVAVRLDGKLEIGSTSGRPGLIKVLLENGLAELEEGGWPRDRERPANVRQSHDFMSKSHGELAQVVVK